MKYIILMFSFISIICMAGCKKEPPQFSSSANDIFWLSSNGSDMPVWVKGNTSSKVIILVIHGGPGEGAYDFSDYETTRLRNNYAMAFWDQRDAGGSAGNNNYDHLSLQQMVADEENVISVLKYRYHNPDIFIYAHSFGGLLAAAYLVKDTNQNNLKGWIEIDGAHNYPLTNSSSQKMLIDTGTSEISKGNNIAQWQTIVQYCKTHDPLTSLSVSTQIETYAHDAEGYMGIGSEGQAVSVFSQEDPSALITNLFQMYYTSAGNNFNQTLQNASYSDQLAKVTIPSLLLWGQYDFTVPPIVGMDAQNHLGSAYKKLVLFPHSGHRPMQGDTNAVEDEIISFIEKFR